MIDCFKYFGSQVVADGGCEENVMKIMNEGHDVWGALKFVLSNKGLGLNAKCL